MSKNCIIQRIFRLLCRPFVQWLMSLIVSMLLAMSLGYAALVIACPRSGNEVALTPISQHAFTVALAIGGLTPLQCMGRQIEAQMTMCKAGNQDMGGREA
jgi:hypothetical protein